MKRRLQHLQQPKRSSSGRLIAPALFLALVLSSTGCPDSSQAPAPPPAVAQKPATQPIVPPQAANQDVTGAGAAAVGPEYTYKPAGRRDPFAPIIVREERKELRGAIPPLERYPLAEFKLTGIVWGGFGYNAVVESPDGKGYFVRAGTGIGQNRGVVKKITKDALIIEEKFKNYLGETERKEITIILRKKQEALP